MGNADAVKDAISDRVNLLYGSDVSLSAPSVGSTPVGSLPAKRPDHGVWDWTVRIKFKMHELHTSFHVFFFLGDVPTNPLDWHTAPNYIGSVTALVNNTPETCSNCIKNQDVSLEKFVHLGRGIARHSKLASLEPNVIKPYLTKALQWRVRQVLVFFFFNICQYMLIIHFLSINSVKRTSGGTSVS